MNIPKFKPTSWNIKFCAKCKCFDEYGHCKENGHEVIERPNIPFFIPRIKILDQRRKWWVVQSEFNQEKFLITHSNTKPIILKYGILPGGIIENKWWMYCMSGGYYSIKIVSDENEKDK